MVRFRASSLDEMWTRIQRWLTKCPICESTDLRCWRYPAIVTFGGVRHERDHPNYDPESNMLFHIMVDCLRCGHTLFFNTEHLVGSNERVLIEGVSLEDELGAELES